MVCGRQFTANWVKFNIKKHALEMGIDKNSVITIPLSISLIDSHWLLWEPPPPLSSSSKILHSCKLIAWFVVRCLCMFEVFLPFFVTSVAEVHKKSYELHKTLFLKVMQYVTYFLRGGISRHKMTLRTSYQFPSLLVMCFDLCVIVAVVTSGWLKAVCSLII